MELQTGAFGAVSGLEATLLNCMFATGEGIGNDPTSVGSIEEEPMVGGCVGACSEEDDQAFFGPPAVDFEPGIEVARSTVIPYFPWGRSAEYVAGTVEGNGCHLAIGMLLDSSGTRLAFWVMGVTWPAGFDSFLEILSCVPGNRTSRWLVALDSIQERLALRVKGASLWPLALGNLIREL
ncbi:hypothetical protein Tco_0862158 [Tanacetum coccineum]